MPLKINKFISAYVAIIIKETFNKWYFVKRVLVKYKKIKLRIAVYGYFIGNYYINNKT